MAYPANMTIGQIRELVENPGMPIRQPATAILTVDTADRIKYDADGFRIDATSPNSIYINKQQTLVNGYFTRIALTEINMEWNTPNVIANGECKNNTLLLERSASVSGPITATYKIELAEGFYTPRELADAIQILLNTDTAFGIATWECSYNERDGSFYLADTSSTVRFRVHPQNLDRDDDLCNLMGFSTPSKSFTFGIFGSYAPMVYTPYFDIVSNQLTKKQNVRDNSSSTRTGSNLLARIYLNNAGFVSRKDRTDPAQPQLADCPIVGTRAFSFYKEYSVPKQIYWDTKEFISVIDLQLEDYKGRPLYMPPQAVATVGPGGDYTQCGNSTNYQLTLQITET